nr:hypothetical protein [Tanacetum cinerariifolium]
MLSSRKPSRKASRILTCFIEDDDSNDDDSDDVTNDDDVDIDADGDNESSDSKRTNSDEDKKPNLSQNDDDEEEYKEEYLRTPNNYEFSDDYEEYEELYKDVNVRLNDAEHELEGKGDAELTDVGRDDGTQETTYEQVKDDEHSTPTPTPAPITETTTTSIAILLDFSSLFGFDQRVSVLEKELSRLKQVDYSAQLLETIKSQIPTMIDAHLSTRLEDSIQKDFRSYIAEFEKKAQGEKKRYIYLIEKLVKDIIKDEVKSQLLQILPKEVSDYITLVIQSTITESLENFVLAKSSSQPKSTYEATASLTEFELKKILLDKMQKSKSIFKRDLEDTDKHEDPPAGSDQRLKKRKTIKDVEPPKGSKSKESKSSSSKGTKSQPKSSGKSAQAEESEFETANTEMPQNQGSDLGNTDDQPIVEAALERDRIAQAEKPLLAFDELMSTPIDFSAYVMNNLKIDNLTQDHLIVFWGITHWGPKRQRFYGFASNRVSKHDVYSSKRIIAVTHVKVMKWYDYGYLEEIEVRKEFQNLYKFKEGDFPRLNLRDIEDMLLLLVQKKIANLERDVIFDLNVALWMFTRRVVILKQVKDLHLGVKSYQKKLNITKPETFRSDISNKTPYTTYNNPQGIIYVDKFKRNRLMRSDELYKFSDGTLTSVRYVLHDIASNLRRDYLPREDRVI